MSDPNDMFGSDSEDDDFTVEEDQKEEKQQLFAQQVLTQLLSHDIKPKVRAALPSHWEKSQTEEFLSKKLLLMYNEEDCCKTSLVSVMSHKLRSAGFDNIVTQSFESTNTIADDFDCIILLELSYSAATESIWRRRIKEMQRRQGHLRVLMPGGLLLIASSLSTIKEPINHLFSDRQWYQPETDRSTGSCHISLWKKRAVLCNETAAIYWTKDLNARPLQEELALLEQLTVPLSVAERDSEIFSLSHRAQIVSILQKYGTVIVTSLHQHDSDLDEAAAELVADMQDTLHHLQERYDIDLLFPQPDQDLENFRELSLREHRRCDLRSTPRLTKLCPPPLRTSAVPTASTAQATPRWTWPTIDVTYLKHSSESPLPSKKDEYSQKDRAFQVSLPDAKSLKTSVVDKLRLHPSMLSAIHETLCPRTDASAGNWGRWNFEGPGPEAPQTIAVGQPGVVFSFPGCTDQTIHADTPHLFEVPVSPPLAPHYLNYFLPMPRPIHTQENSENDELVELDMDDCYDTQETAIGGGKGRTLRGQRVGQTAFVVGSHSLEVTKRVMADDDIVELLRRLVRPMYFPGDALVFDCRILHFGLANQLPAMPTSVTSLPAESCERQQAEQTWREEVIRDTSRWRPLIYINCTKDWFQDPKNWNDRRNIYPSTT